jgi:hypothetical protein
MKYQTICYIKRCYVKVQICDYESGGREFESLRARHTQGVFSFQAESLFLFVRYLSIPTVI